MTLRLTILTTGVVLLLLSGGMNYSSAQESCTMPATRAWLTLTETGGFGWDTIWCGFDPTATYGIDPQLCEYECLGIDYLFVFCDLPGRHSMGEGTLHDFRRYQSATQIDTYRVQYGLNWTTTYTFHWSPARILAICDSAVLLNRTTGARLRMDRSDSTHDESEIFDMWLIRFGAKPTSALGIKETAGVPLSFQLLPNYPNPFNPSTNIQFTVGGRTHAVLNVFDPIGREVAVLLNSEVEKGTHTVQFDGRDLSSGVYFVRLQAGGGVASHKILLLK
jgi:hypothetical protein